MSKTPAAQQRAGNPPPAAPDGSAAAGHCPACGSPLRSGARFCDACGAPLGSAAPAGGLAPTADTFVSVAIGLLLLLFVPFFKRSLEYVFTRSHPESFSWTFNDATGNPLPYPQTAFFLPDIGLTLFAIALIFEGILMIFWRRFKSSVLLSITISGGIVLFNIYALARSYGQSDTIERFLSAIVIAFGAYACLYQITLYRALLREQVTTASPRR